MTFPMSAGGSMGSERVVAGSASEGWTGQTRDENEVRLEIEEEM